MENGIIQERIDKANEKEIEWKIREIGREYWHKVRVKTIDIKILDAEKS